jgi:RHS repeat-associated protein
MAGHAGAAIGHAVGNCRLITSVPFEWTDLNTITAGTYTYYDALGRPTLVRQTSELGDLDTTTQYLAGFKTRVVLPKHQVPNPTVYTETTYQAWDQPTTEFPKTIAQPEGVQTTIDRDAFGKPLSVIRGGGGVTATRHYVYRPDWQTLCKVIEPETGATVMDFDAAGNLGWSASGLDLPSTTDCNLGEAWNSGRRVGRSYDARNRLETLGFPDTRGNQDWSYTPDGLPLSVTTANVPGAVHPINQYQYNKRRLLTSETQHLPAWYSYSLGYQYDANGSLKRITYPSSDYVDFAPNALGQARQVTGPHVSTPGATMNYASQVTYHPNGSLAGFTYGNGIAYQMSYSPDPNARPLPRFVKAGSVLDLDYRYDKHGNIDTILDATRPDNWGNINPSYDDLDRLTHVGYPQLGGNHHMYFTYDALDNLKTWKHPAAGGAGMVRDHLYCYNGKNQLELIRSGATACSGAGAGSAAEHFQYDLQGNVEIHDDGFDFDYGNRLREVIYKERYRYDAHGRRILAMNFATGTITSQYGNSGQLLYQKNQRTGQEKQVDHIYLGGSLIAQREQPLELGGTAVVKYLHTDALGSPVAVTDAGGAPIEQTDYAPYGKQLDATATVGRDRPGYTGHVRDQASGLNYMQQRYYDPAIGRFLSVDPVTADPNTGGNFNRYKYAGNNPYRFFDPDGREERERRDWSSLDSCLSCAGANGSTVSLRSSGEHKPLTFGQALKSNFDRNVQRSPLGPGGKDAMHFLGDEMVEGMGNLIDGNFGSAAENLAIGVVAKKLGPLSNKVEGLIGEARSLYPGKAGKVELHHITPRYLGGAKNGALAPLDAAYHQQITNEFRRQWPYGGARPDAQQLDEVMQKVYEKYPLP